MVIGVQSHHANPVFLYYLEPDRARREFRPVSVKPSVAQAAMIGNPVSMPRVIHLVEKYRSLAGEGGFQVIEVSEQEIMDAMLLANRNGHISCTQGGECLAGIRRAVEEQRIDSGSVAVLDATAHALKFAVFQEKYYSDSFEPEYGVSPRKELQNQPRLVEFPQGMPSPSQGAHLTPDEFQNFLEFSGREIAGFLGLKSR
jgi:threonine synthase